MRVDSRKLSPTNKLRITSGRGAGGQAGAVLQVPCETDKLCQRNTPQSYIDPFDHNCLETSVPGWFRVACLRQERLDHGLKPSQAAGRPADHRPRQWLAASIPTLVWMRFTGFAAESEASSGSAAHYEGWAAWVQALVVIAVELRDRKGRTSAAEAVIILERLRHG